MSKMTGSEQNEMPEGSNKLGAEQEHLYRLLFEHANDAIYVYELLPDGTPGPFLEVNELACHRLGYSRAELMQVSFSAIGRPDENQERIQAFLDQLRIIGRGSFETIHVAKNGTYIPVEINCRLIKLSNKQIILSLARDLTERKRAENELIEKNNELDQFAYIVSHDLKAPLRAINNLSQWIEEDLGPVATDEIRTNMGLLRGRVRRMENLIQGILEYSRVGREKSSNVECDVRQLLDDIIQDLKPPHQFVIEILDDMPIFTTQAIKLRQVFANLIGNGIKHHHRGDGRIQISAQDAGRFYKFSVSDDGPGIAAINHEKVFTIFHVMQPRDQQENTGVGLAIVKKIVEEQKGEILLTSKPDQGAVFSFTWAKE
ncbi:MAG: sensor signal transduction histidine kinase [Firmicutes bacterium]|nr:sensor signal transduction histidine kinase [Bacillota bacterium]